LAALIGAVLSRVTSRLDICASSWRVPASKLQVSHTLALVETPGMLDLPLRTCLQEAGVLMSVASKHVNAYGYGPFTYGMFIRSKALPPCLSMNGEASSHTLTIRNHTSLLVQVVQQSSVEFENVIAHSRAAQHVLMKWKDNASAEAFQRYVDLVPNMADEMDCVMGVVVYPLKAATGMVGWHVNINTGQWDAMLVVFVNVSEVKCYVFNEVHGRYFYQLLEPFIAEMLVFALARGWATKEE